ncbi:MAG: protein kinase [Deltaproteobacteria bacterium]|nr:protein kinase [Deltaproteobacteria bacterium]
MKLCTSCHNGLQGAPARCPLCDADLGEQDEVSGDELCGMRVADKYQLVQLVGDGAMGWVYRGVHQTLNRSVAVKLLKTSTDAQPEQVRRFEQEALAVSRLNHPHIVSVIDFGQSPGGLFYLVTEFVAGNTLTDLLYETGRLPVGQALGIFHQLLAGVEEAHSAGVVHRDLKPDNVVVTPLRSGDDFVKILDFGIAAVGGAPGTGPADDGPVMGTPGFMAPETILKGVSTERSDIYALGVVLFELLVGRPPFEHTMPMVLLAMHANETPPALREAAPEVGYPPELEQVMAQALAKDPGDRFGSIAELRTALQAAVNQMGRAELDCQSCARPIDPDTGLCNLHGPSWTPPTSSQSGPPLTSSAPPSSSQRPADGTSRTLVSPHALGRDELQQRVFGVDIVCRDGEAADIVDFLLGARSVMEVTGEPGAGKTATLVGLAATAESLDYRVIHLEPDDRQAGRPWYPFRRLVGQALGCGTVPATKRSLQEAAEPLGLSTDQLQGLAALFGLSSARAPEQGVEHARMVRRSAAAVVAALQDGAAGTCLIAEDPLDYDRASQGLLRALPQLLGRRLTKLAVSSDGGFFPDRDDRVILRPGGLDVDGIGDLLDRANDGRDAQQLAQTIAEATGGNALGVHHLIAALGEGADLDAVLSDPIGWRISQLSEEAAEVLQVVCAAGHDVPRALVAELTGHEPRDPTIDLLIDRGLLMRASGPVAALTPTHSAVAAAALQLMAVPGRSQLHGRLLEVMRAQGASVFVLAHHAFEAQLESLAEEALDLLVAAGDEACRWADVETAALVHYRKAVQAARWRLLMSEEDERYLKLSLRLGHTLAAVGHRRAAEVVYREVAGGAGRHPRLLERARSALSELPPKG